MWRQFPIKLSNGSAGASKSVQCSRVVPMAAQIRTFSVSSIRQHNPSAVASVAPLSYSPFGGIAHRRLLFQNHSSIVSSRGFASLPPFTEIGLPALSPSMEKGNISKWKKKEGDQIKPADVIAEIETDKATVDFEATEDGFLAKILLPEGSKDIPIGAPICIKVDKAEHVAAFKDYVPTGAAPPKPAAEAPKPTPEAPKPAASAPKPAQPTGKWIPGAPPPPTPGGASYLAKATASQTGVNLGSVQGTGPSGRIIQADVLEAKTVAVPAAFTPLPTSSGAQYTDIQNSQIRKVIAERLTQSKQQIPHYYLTMECRIDQLSTLRGHLNDKAKGEFKLSVNDFVIKAAALACTKVPEANSSWLGDSIRRYNNVDINVAVNTDRGLMTPLIKDADKVGLVHINRSVKDMAERAKIGKLTPLELSSGTFTISNLGMFGIKHFTAIINPPQACILAVGASDKRVTVNEAGGKENPYSVGEYMSVTLSCDHRVIDGAIGAQWLQKFKEYMEDPTKMLL